MMNNFFQELKRRNVVKVALAYAVVSWATLQFVDIVAPLMGLPEVFQKGVLVLLAVGFPIALLLSWAYEVTPEGVKKTAEVDKSQSITPKTGQAINKLIVGALLLALGFIAYDKVIGSGPILSDREASIAVLPFADLSEGQDQGYFADGISEEILNVLAKIPGLKVAGRTSSFKFKGQNEDLRLIGDQLDVDHVLEGSVRKEGSHIRITVQLIAADDGFHLWSETFDRQDADIFAIQDEISKAVAEALQIKLGTGDEPFVEQETKNPEAYSLYLRARQLLHSRGADNLDKAAKLFEAVTVLDPNFDKAYSGFARAASLLPGYDLSITNPEPILKRGEVAGKKAIELNPQNAEAYSALSFINVQEYDWAEAGKNELIATTLAPNDAEVANFAGDYYRAVGDYENAIKWEKRALDLDPLHVVNAWDLAFAYNEFHEPEKGLPYAEKALQIDPNYSNIYQVLVYILSDLGRLDEARDMIAIAEARGDDPFFVQDFKTRVAVREGDKQKAYSEINKLVALIEKGEGPSSWVTQYYFDIGDIEKGAEWVERAYREKDANFTTLIPAFLPEDYSSDPAFISRLELPGMKELFDIRRKNRAAGNGPKE